MLNRVIVRPALREDIDTLVRFSSAMALETEGRQLEKTRLRQGTRAVLDSPDRGFYMVAELADRSPRRVVGQLLVTFEWSDWRNAVFWWIQSVYVDPEFRGRRIFSLLFNHLKDKAQTARNVAGLRLYVDKTNKKAREVYRSCGMLPSHYVFYETEF